MGFGHSTFPYITHTNWQRINISNRFPMIIIGLYGIIVLSVVELLLPIDFPLNTKFYGKKYVLFVLHHPLY